MTHKVQLTELKQVLHNEKSFLAALNSNLQALQDMLDKSLSRDGTVPNQMEEVLDMNGKRIINVGTAEEPTDVVTKADIQSIINEAEEAIARLGSLVQEAQYTLEVYGREVIVEAVAAKDAAVVAKQAAQDAQSSANASATSAAASAQSAEEAKEATEGASESAWNWARKTDGIVSDAEGTDYSAKAYAIGGTGTQTNNAKYFKEQAATLYSNIQSTAAEILERVKAVQTITIGTPSGSYTGGTDKIETGLDMTNKTVDLFWNGQMLMQSGNWRVVNNNVMLDFDPPVGSIVTLWINCSVPSEEFSKVIIRQWS